MQHATRRDQRQPGDGRGDRGNHRPAVRSVSPCTNPYRLEVFTSSVHEVVTEAGGWIVDHVLAGWTVTVITDAADDTARAVKILGCQVNLRSALLDPTSARPYGIALTSTLCAADRDPQTWIVEALGLQASETSLSGVRRSRLRDAVPNPVTHCPSSAAQAFKAHSLAAVGLPNRLAAVTETILRAVLPVQAEGRGR